MAQYNPEDYDLVENRIRKLYEEHPNARIITINETTPQDRASLTWVMRAEIYLIDDDGCAYLKSTGYAFEIDGTGGANKTSALENAETSAIGRALANAGYSGNKRASREEMAKVDAGVTPVGRDWLAEARLCVSKSELRKLYEQAMRSPKTCSKDTLAQIADLAANLPE